MPRATNESHIHFNIPTRVMDRLNKHFDWGVRQRLARILFADLADALDENPSALQEILEGKRVVNFPRKRR